MNYKSDLKRLLCIMIMSSFISFSSCTKSEDVKSGSVKPEVDLVDFINFSSNGSSQRERIKVVHLSADTVYILKDNFTREAGEQLIIDAGTLIKANTNNNGSAPSITILPDGLITATGTPANPVVFTGNNRKGTQGANWGGIIIQGKSFNNSNGSSGVPDDFSGVMQFVRVEFGNVALVAVGNKTVFENIMVSYTDQVVYALYQSAFNILGGTFNTRNLISYANSGPADFFITNGYTGNMQNLIASRHPFFGHTGNGPDNTLTGLFIQNNIVNSPAPLPYTNPVISNLTIVGPHGINGSPAAYQDTNLLAASLITTNSACFHIRNSILLGFPAACWILNEHATAENLRIGNGELGFSRLQTDNNSRCFYLAPGSLDPFNSDDFKNFMLRPSFQNQVFQSTGDFQLENISSYETGPNLMPSAGSPILTGASYDSSSFYGNSYFDQSENFLGAIGTVNWLRGWTNFVPLKTNYNFPE